MKLFTVSLTLIAAALLPTFAYASTEMMSAERGPHCDLSTATVIIVVADNKPDIYEEAVVAAMNSTSDPVVASYYRDLYYPSPTYKTVTFVRIPDPYVDAISRALYGSVEPDSQQAC